MFSGYNILMLTHESEGNSVYVSRLKTPQTENLVRALLSVKDEGEYYQLLEDLCTVREIRDLAQRLEVAQLLKNGVTYSEIVEKTGVSTATIGRVNRSLTYGAGGYKLVLERIAQKDT